MKPRIITKNKSELFADQAGSKAGNLFYLQRNNICVPDLFCIPCNSFSEFLSPKRRDIQNILNKLNDDSTNVEIISRDIYRLLSPLKFNDNLAAEIDKYLGNHFSCEYFSVRSSSSKEDSADKSFAGLFETFLYVKKSEVTEHVKLCWLSAFNPNILSYCVSKDIDPLDLNLGVIIQEMIPSISSGVMFTANPFGSLTEMIVVAGFGLGEGIVADKVETDTYIYNKESKTLEKNISRKTSQIVFDAQRKTGTSREKIPEELQEEPVLSDDAIQKLVDTGLRINKMYDHFQDIEWCIDKNDNIYILQSRPITTILQGQFSIFDNNHISENFPHITLPLTYSYVQETYKWQLANAVAKMISLRINFADHEHLFNNTVGYFQGRIYINLTSWLGISKLLPLPRKIFRSMFDNLLGHLELKSENSKKDDESRLFNFELAGFVFRLIRQLIMLDSSMKRYKKFFLNLYNQTMEEDLGRLNNHEIIIRSDYVFYNFFKFSYIPVINDFMLILFIKIVIKLFHKLKLTNPENLFNELMCGEENVESVLPVRSIVHMGEMVRENKELRDKLEFIVKSNDPIPALNDLLEAPANLTFAECFRSHLQNYGDRFPEELKIEKDSFRENPALLVEAVLRNVPANITVQGMIEKELLIRKNAEEIVSNSLKFSPFKKILIQYLINKTRKMVKNRESGRFDRARMIAMVRRLTRILGKNLEKEKAIDSRCDIFYLTKPELSDYVFGSGTIASLKEIVKARKQEFADYQSKDPSGRLIFKGTANNNFIVQNEIPENSNQEKTLHGLTCCPGVVEGEAVIIHDPSKAPDTTNKILVARNTDPGWVYLMISSAGLISEKGNILTHTAIIGRELGIPTLVGVKDATSIIKNGQRIRLNATTGEVILL
jgi:rifampicin phosphotransferase